MFLRAAPSEKIAVSLLNNSYAGDFIRVAPVTSALCSPVLPQQVIELLVASVKDGASSNQRRNTGGFHGTTSAVKPRAGVWSFST